MTLMTRASVVAAFCSLLVAACGGGPGKGDGGGGSGGGTGASCAVDEDCGNVRFYSCNMKTLTCEPSCTTKDDCTSPDRPVALDYCGGALGCQCDALKCVASLCAADVDCGGTSVCRSGKCEAAPDATAVTKCVVTPSTAILKTGQKMKFSVAAFGAGDVPVVLKTGIAWTAVAGSGSVPASSSGASVEFTAANAAAAAADAVTATIGTKTCSANITVISGSPTAGKIGVLAIDELTGRPIDGATVVANKTDGSALGTGSTATTVNGYAEVSYGTETAVSVTLYHDNFSYLTVANYKVAGSRLLSMVTRRNQLDKYGGYKGKFKNVPATGSVHLGIAGMSIPGSVTDLDFNQLIGPSVPTNIKLGTVYNMNDVPVPAGIYMGFSNTEIKTNYAGFGIAGTCGNATKEKDGTCGTRTAWALSGDVEISDVPISEFTNGLGGVNFAKVLTPLIPVFRKFNSSVVRDVQFDLVAGDPQVDAGHLVPVDHDFAQVPLAFGFAAKVPSLPKLNDKFVDAAILLGGAIVPGRGVVPLGIGAGINDKTAFDDKTDKEKDLPAAGLVSMRVAPTHHGLEGTQYAMVALAISLAGATSSNAGLATSALLARLPGNKLPFDPKGTTPVAFRAKPDDASSPELTFLAHPEHATYNFLSTTKNTVLGRQFKFVTAPNLSDVSVIRVVLQDGAQHRWVIYLDPAEASTGFRLPTPPGAFSDRSFSNDSLSNSPRSFLFVQTVRLNKDPVAGGGAISFNELVEQNDFNGDRMVDFTTGFAVMDYARPSVEFLSPVNDGDTLTKSAGPIKLKVRSFKIGSTTTEDGFVRVSFTGGTGCGTPIDVKTDASGKGEINVDVAAGCSGASVAITATLMDNATPAAPLNPPADSTLSNIKIQ